MIPQTFLPPHLTTFSRPLSPLPLIILGLVLTAVLCSYVRTRRRQPHTRYSHQDPEHYPTPISTDNKHPSPPTDYPPTTSTSTSTYTDLPLPLRTTLHTPLTSRPWTSADLASHPGTRQSYTLSCCRPPAQYHHHHDHHDHQQQNIVTPGDARAHSPPTRVHVTDTLRYFPLSPPSSPRLSPPEFLNHASVMPPPHSPPKQWRRRRTLVFETVAADAETKKEGPEKDIAGSSTERRPLHAPGATESGEDNGNPAGDIVVRTMAEADVWGRMRDVVIDI